MNGTHFAQHINSLVSLKLLLRWGKCGTPCFVSFIKEEGMTPVDILTNSQCHTHKNGDIIMDMCYKLNGANFSVNRIWGKESVGGFSKRGVFPG